MRLIETLKTPEPQNSKKLDRQTFGRSCREAPAQHIHVAPTYPSEGKHSSSLEKHFWYLVSCAQPSLWHILRAGCSCVCYLFTDCVAQSAGFLSPLASSSPRDFPELAARAGVAHNELSQRAGEKLSQLQAGGWLCQSSGSLRALPVALIAEALPSRHSIKALQPLL